MLDVCLLGTAGMMPLPNRWLTALMLRYNGSSLLIDCGEGTQIAMKEAWMKNNMTEFELFCAECIEKICKIVNENWKNKEKLKLKKNLFKSV